MKFWRSKLACLNEKFCNYIKDHCKVVDYEVKKPSLRTTDLTWRPYGYYRRIRINMARRKCLRLGGLYLIEARSSVQKRKIKMEFDTDSYDILIDNCCSHSLTNCKVKVAYYVALLFSCPHQSHPGCCEIRTLAGSVIPTNMYY
jgi:hypothetical protein